MPSVSVPLKGQAGWDKLQTSRRKFWKQAAHNKLTEHFKADEFYCHDGSAPPIRAEKAMIRLCQVFLEPMRKKFGEAQVLSGYRHVLYNASIGGARNSQHIYEYSYECVAADMRFQKGTPTQWAAEAKKIRAAHGGRGGVGTYPKAGFVHVDNRLYSATWSG